MVLRKGHHKVGSRVEKKDGTKSKPAMGKKGTIKRSVCLLKYTVRWEGQADEFDAVRINMSLLIASLGPH